MKYIDADQLKAEIRKRLKKISKSNTVFTQGKRDAYNNLLSFLDSIPEQEHPIYQLNQILLDWVREAKTDKEQEARFEAHKRFFELYDEYMMQEPEQPEINIPSAGSGAMGTTPPKFKLEVKEQPDGLEEAADKQAFIESPYSWESQPGTFGSTPLFLMSNIRSAFIAGAEWQAEKCDEETSKLLYAERQTAYIYGWDDHKEQMLKDAVEIEVKEDAGGFPIVPLDAIELYDYENDKPLAKAGDKVRVIVIPNTDEK